MNNKSFFYVQKSSAACLLAMGLVLTSPGAWSADKHIDAQTEYLDLTVPPAEVATFDPVRDVTPLSSLQPRSAGFQDTFKSALNNAIDTAVQSSSLVEAGVASWYGKAFQGRRTASGERFDMNELTAAHKTLPLGSVVQVRNPLNGKTVDVTINDRGPYVKGRIIDLSYRAALALGIVKAGKESVEVHRR
jgi:rare lipoprotein A (peptidoglycan hydrolase)